MPIGVYIRTKPIWNKGKSFSEETRRKMSISASLRKRSPLSEETKNKISLANSISQRFRIGGGMLGKHHSEETKQKIRDKISGPKSRWWKGGISQEYPKSFNRFLREKIRERDEYKCRVCGCPQEECSSKLATHHIDYDKNNSNINNLISLCPHCHRIVHNDEIGWIEKLRDIIYGRTQRN